MPRPWLRLLDPEIHDLQHVAKHSPADSLRFARALNSRCRHEEAAEVLDQLLADNRCDGELWFERLLALGDQVAGDELETFHKDLEALRSEHPKEAAHLRNLGYALLLLDREDEAELAFRRALELDGHDPKTLELIGLICLQRDHPAEARTWLLKSLSLQPKDPRTLRLLGLVCELLEDPKGAENHFLAALNVDVNFFWGWHSLGELFIKQGELLDGLRCIHRARALMPMEPTSYFILAELFSEQGHLEMALAEMHKLVLLSPNAATLAEAYSLMGEIRKDMGDSETAISYFALAAETDPEDPNPWSAMGDLAREEERWEDALRCYREALARDPEAADVQVQLGYVLLHTGLPQDAEKCFMESLEADPSEYSAYLGLSECYRQLQRGEDQCRMVREAMALAPADPDVWNAQGVALEMQGQLAQATEAYEKALAFAPQHRKAANNLGFLLEKRMAEGESQLKERAVEAWKQRLLICRDEGQSLKMASEHLVKLGVSSAIVQRWLEKEPGPVF
ncbi:MAG: repeat protein [Holophagaceae bacterium]|nr:repeat protein [Holophagaceae bacterium]